MDRTLIVITGPIASGKSALARRLAGVLRQCGWSAAVVDLDLVYSMLADDPKSDDAIWRQARQTAGAMADALFAQGCRAVIVEGEFWTSDERQSLLECVTTLCAIGFVTLRVSFDEALRRAQADATRGLSKEPAFLRRQMARFTAALPNFPATDLLLDSESASVDAHAAQIAKMVQMGRITPRHAGR